MKAAFFRAHGGPEVLQVGDLPSPSLGAGDVRVRVQACALNHLDLWVRQGGRAFPLPLPHVGGTDVAGVVVEVGKDVGTDASAGAGRGGTRSTDAPADDKRGGTGGAVAGGGTPVAVGDEVVVNPGLNFFLGDDGEMVPPPRPEIVGETRWGGLAQECVVPATNVLPKPEGLSWPEAAALPLAGLTAMQMLRKVRVREGDRVLVPGGGGGVSVMAIQIAKARGAWVVATTSTGKVDKIRDIGADEVLDYKADPEWSKKAFLLTQKRGFDVVVDSVGAATWPHSLRALGPGGRLVTCGATTGAEGPTDIRQLFWKQLTVRGSTMGTREDLEEVLALVADGKVRPVVDSVLPLDRVREAHERLEKGEQIGKVVLTP